MRVGQAKELFRSLTKEYFAEAQVVFANQSRTPMQAIPLVVITPGNVNRPTHPNYEVVDGVLVGNYLSRFSLTVDLFSNGAPVIDEETDETVAYETTQKMICLPSLISSILSTPSHGATGTMSAFWLTEMC